MDFIKDWIGNEIEYTILPLTKNMPYQNQSKHKPIVP